MRAVAVGLLIEEQRGEIAGTWRRIVEDELGADPAIGFAVGPLLREMALALRGEEHRSARTSTRADGDSGVQRCAVLVRSGAQPARVAREFKLLHRAIWDTLRGAGRIVAADERRAVDEWLDEALASALERLERVRARVELLESGASAPFVSASRVATMPQRPPPLPRVVRSALRPPPLPAAVGRFGE